MKLLVKQHTSKSGFTLIELLVVMAIIGILAGLLFPVVYLVKEKGRKAKAGIEAKQIENAVKQYYIEYGKFPHGNGNVTDWAYGNPSPSTCSGNACNKELMNVLRAVTNSTAIGNVGGVNNPRMIIFLDVPQQSIDSDGNYTDPWGKTSGQYRIITDVTFDNICNDTTSGGYGNISNKTVIVYSCGKDGQPNTTDDVTSW